MINKIVYPDANEALFEACEGSMAKIVLNTEKSIKEASSNSITKKMLEDCRPDKDHFLIHFIGVGDYEKYGFNKNADAFPKKANEKYYDTFVKNGHLFREHKSDNPEVNAIGQIKKAMYNPEMGRIELAVWANIKKASEEYEKALAGETLSCSMGCSVPVDRDSISGKLCKRPSEYEPWMKKTPGQYIPEYKKYAFVYNDEPSFFDLSIVKRPAERIAHYLEYKFASDNTDGLLKAASDNNGYIPSALLAELQGIKFSLTKGFRNIKKANTLKRLIELEKDFANAISDKQDNTVKGLYIKNAAINSFSKDFDLSDSELKEFTNLNIRKESFFREMAKRASIMNFKSFIDFIYPEDKSEEKQQAVKLASCQILPTLFNGLNNFGIDLNELDNLFDSGSEFDCIADNSNSDPIQKLFDKASDKFSIDKNGRDKRIISITIINNGGSTSANNILENILPTIFKTASLNSNNYSKEVINKAKKYATAYAVYKIAAINDIEKLQGKELDEATLLSLIGQNYIYNI